MNFGKYIFAQVIDFIPSDQFAKLVKKYKGEWHAKNLTCYNQLLHLLFGQITGCDSIRDICLCLEAHDNCIYHLGIRKSVNQSNLCRANEKEITASMKNLECISSASSDLCIRIQRWQR